MLRNTCGIGLAATKRKFFVLLRHRHVNRPVTATCSVKIPFALRLRESGAPPLAYLT